MEFLWLAQPLQVAPAVRRGRKLLEGADLDAHELHGSAFAVQGGSAANVKVPPVDAKCRCTWCSQGRINNALASSTPS